MPLFRLHLVMTEARPQQPCTCPTWGLLSAISRDLILADLMDWAVLLHQVQLKLLVRGNHVAICELLTVRPGQGRAGQVMTELSAWADCTRVTLELSPSDHWGSNTERLTRFYESLGFQQNNEPEQSFRSKEAMIRFPVRGRGQVWW